GDLEIMIESLNSLIKNIKILLMIVPALIGTLNVPGGAILSAPMVEESGKRIKMDMETINAINLFFRHVGFFIYPLYSTLILMSELLEIEVLTIIKYNFIIMLVGLISAYVVLFRNQGNDEIPEVEMNGVKESIINFFISFLPVFVILVLALIFDVPFHYAVITGVLVGIVKNKTDGPLIKGLYNKIKKFIFKGVDYQLVFTIAGLMAFKAVVEKSGFVDNIAEVIIRLGVPLPLLVTGLGLIAGYITGLHVAAAGMLVPLFAPMIAESSIPVYAALIFTTINIGYVISPLHLCMILGNQYFDVSIKSVYRKLVIPLSLMICVALLQLWIFT
ncbi:MAG: DUF401 family protein, partial [Halanaerobiaceae bacterium]